MLTKELQPVPYGSPLEPGAPTLTQPAASPLLGLTSRSHAYGWGQGCLQGTSCAPWGFQQGGDGAAVPPRRAGAPQSTSLHTHTHTIYLPGAKGSPVSPSLLLGPEEFLHCTPSHPRHSLSRVREEPWAALVGQGVLVQRARGGTGPVGTGAEGWDHLCSSGESGVSGGRPGSGGQSRKGVQSSRDRTRCAQCQGSALEPHAPGIHRLGFRPKLVLEPDK